MKKSRELAIDAVFGSVSLVLAFFSRAKVLPFIGRFINLDFSDLPIFVLALLLGARNSFLALLSVSIIRVLTFDVHSILIFMFRMSSVIFLPFLEIYRKKRKYFLILSVVSLILYLLLRFPISYLHWCVVRKVPQEWFFGVMIWQINFSILIRSVVNLVISKVVSEKIKNRNFEFFN